jgi:hypothetical protein
MVVAAVNPNCPRDAEATAKNPLGEHVLPPEITTSMRTVNVNCAILALLSGFMLQALFIRQ